MSAVQHIENTGGAVSMFAGSEVVATTPKKGSAYAGPTAATEKLQHTGEVAFWGPTNMMPQQVADDIDRVNIVASVINAKVEILTSGEFQYGTVEYGPNGETIRKPKRIPEIQGFLDDMDVGLYVRESAWELYSYYNYFPEITMGKGRDRVVGLGVHDCLHVRLGTMHGKGKIDKAYVGDWTNISGVGECDATIHALDPYYRVAQQIIDQKKERYILPSRYLDRGRFYYGLAPWNSLRANGWLDIARRVPELKKHLLNNLMHIRYHIEFDDRYWRMKYKGWDQKSEAEQVQLQTDEVQLFENWAKGKAGQGGVFMSKMVESMVGKDMAHLVVINELKMGIADGAYLQDVQEVDHIICRDMGLKPSYLGISPSKSGSSPGSGSEERVTRVDHLMDSKNIADLIVKPFKYTAKVNGWPADIEFWLSSNYVSTLDRTTKAVASTNGKGQNPEEN